MQHWRPPHTRRTQACLGIELFLEYAFAAMDRDLQSLREKHKPQ